MSQFIILDSDKDYWGYFWHI